MDLQQNEQLVKTWAQANAPFLGLHPSRIEVSYIWNPGGFVNQSYRVSDGDKIRHLKLSKEDHAPSLKQWASIHKHLADHYHAPRLIFEVNHGIVPGYAYGLVFDFIQGQPLAAASEPEQAVEKAFAALRQLHSDSVIKSRIEAASLSYADAFADMYISRFEEDLEAIVEGKRLLSFVTDDTLEWFEAEIGKLKQLVQTSSAFQKTANDVVHNDINWQNILTHESGELWIIDWDDLAANGDAAMDYSVLLWPLYQSKTWDLWIKRLAGLADEELLERLEIYFRAKLLDDVIDVLADYVEAEHIPEVKEITQAQAKEIHLRAYPKYLQLYGK